MTVWTPLPSRNEAVLRHVLESQAARIPDRTCVSFAGGEVWTYLGAQREMFRAGNVLRAAGVGFGDRVLVCLGNGPSFMRAWFGIASLGAVMCPINPALRGTMLQQMYEVAVPRAVVTTKEDLQAFRDLTPSPVTLLTDDDLATGTDTPPALERPIEPWDPHAMNFTSGTTGISKGVVTTYLHNHSLGSNLDAYVSCEDVMLVDLALYHQGGQTATVMFRLGGSLAVTNQFTGHRYWEVARQTGVTFVTLISSMANFLLAQPAKAQEKEHNIRLARIMPMVNSPASFRERFNIDRLITAYGMTELSVPLFSDDPDSQPTSVGRRRSGYDVRLVDDHDVPVPTGETGELIVRTDQPWRLMVEYFGHPQATASAWRNGWFHTGDLFREDAEGNFYFADRKKDAIRRRGENISSFEVEREVRAHPEVDEVACIGIPTPLGDEDVKIFVVARSGNLDPAELHAFLAERMPDYMVPRYIELVPTLPKTHTLRVKKQELRERGNSESNWDAAAYHP